MANIYQFVDKDNPMREKLKEVKGIGTPATRDTIIAELLAARKGVSFLEKKGKELVPTDWAIQFCSIIDPALTQPDTTATMELALTNMINGQETLEHYMESMISFIDELINDAENKNFPPPVTAGIETDHVHCPYCEKGLLIHRFSKKTNKGFYVCNNDDCVSPFTNKKVYYADSKKGPVLVECPHCKANGITSILSSINGKFGTFWACGNLNCKSTFKDKNGKPDLSPKKGKSN